MAIILFAIAQSRDEICNPVAWIYFEIRFTLTWFWKTLNQEPKGCSWHEEKTKVLLMIFYRLFDCPSLTLGHCQLLPHERGEGEHEK